MPSETEGRTESHTESSVIPRECKRLAEVDLPIAVVSKHTARGESTRWEAGRPGVEIIEQAARKILAFAVRSWSDRHFLYQRE